MKTLRTVVVLLSALMASSWTSATTLNFETLGKANLDLHATTADLPEASISVSIPMSEPNETPTLVSNEFFANEGGSICGAIRTPSSLSCVADLHIDFHGMVKNLSFQIMGFDQMDSGEVSALGGVGHALTTRLFTDPSSIDFDTLSGIRGLLFHNTGTGSGYGFGKFSFDISPLPVPEPQSWLLMALGLATVVATARRRQSH